MRRLLPIAALALLLFANAAPVFAQFPEGEESAGEVILEDLEGEELSEEELEAELAEEQMWKWANFVILAAVLGYMMAKFLPPAFASRTQEIQKEITEAQAAKAEADRRAAEVEQRLARLSKDIDTFRASAAVDMQQEGERIRKETAAQMKRVEQQASLEIETAGKTARRELKEYSAELALQLAEDRVRHQLNPDTSAALVDGFIADLAKQGAQGQARKN